MKTIDQLSQELQLTPSQKSALEAFIGELVIDLLESIKQDNIRNFEDTIKALKQP